MFQSYIKGKDRLSTILAYCDTAPNVRVCGIAPVCMFNIPHAEEYFRKWDDDMNMVGDLEKSSFSNIEQQSLEFVKYTIDP